MENKKQAIGLPPMGMPRLDGPGELPKVVMPPMGNFGGMPMGGPSGPEGPGGLPPRKEEAVITPAVYIDDGKYLPEKSIAAALAVGEVLDESAAGIRIKSEIKDLNGVYVRGAGSKYTLSDSVIELSGNGDDDFTGVGAGAMANKGGTLVLKNVKIVTSGVVRTATVATNSSNMYVYNSYLETKGGILPEDYVPKIGPGMLEPPAPLGIKGTCRTNLTMENSESYFYDSTIIAEGWGALSTDSAKDNVYLEANNCVVKAVKSGYCAYADGNCHDVFNDCEFTSADMAAIIAGKSDITFRNTNAVCGTYFAMIHCVMGMTSEVGVLDVSGGKITSDDDLVLIKSANTYIKFIGSELTAKGGTLIHSVVNDDPMVTKVNGEEVYGIKVALINMSLQGDIVHEDPERAMSVTMEGVALKGAIKNAYLGLDKRSSWTATSDSEVILVGINDIAGIDALSGVTIKAAKGGDCSLEGEYTLKSGGILKIEV